MLELFILDTPEFDPIAHIARQGGMRVERDGDYLVATSGEPQVVLERRHAEVRPSIWFAAITGGMSGRIVNFDHDELRIAADV